MRATPIVGYSAERKKPWHFTAKEETSQRLASVGFTCGMAEPALDALNRAILMELQERGIAVPSGTTLSGPVGSPERPRYAIRVANTNHRSRRSDFDALVDAVVRIGLELVTAEFS